MQVLLERKVMKRGKMAKRKRDNSEGTVSDDVEREEPRRGSSKEFTTPPVQKSFKPPAPVDPVIGISVPRKARSALAKRLNENRVANAGAAPLPPPMDPLSPASLNVPGKKKLEINGGPKEKEKAPQLSANADSSAPEVLEMEIAEVLYGLMNHKDANSSANAHANRQNNELKISVSSPIQNSVTTSSSNDPFSVVAPKRKKPRHLPGNIKGSSILSSRVVLKGRSILSPSVKPEINQASKIESLLPNSEKKPKGGSKNGDTESVKTDFAVAKTPSKAVESAVEDVVAARPEESHGDVAMTAVKSTSSEMAMERQEKNEIGLMATAQPEKEAQIDIAAKPAVTAEDLMETHVEETNASKSGGNEMLVEAPELEKAKPVHESDKDRNIDLEKSERKIENVAESLSGNVKSCPHVEKQPPQSEVSKNEQPHTEKTAQPNSLQLPMSQATWPGGLTPMSYMGAPLQGVVSMDGSQVHPTPVQPMFSQPRPKRCAMHCYIAKNILRIQQFMRMNPFLPVAAGAPGTLFGVKPPTELQGRANVPVQDNGQGLAIFPGQVGKEKAAQPPSTMADAQRKQQQQQVFLQQALPAGTPPSSMMPGPAFLFPFNQQQAAAATAATSIRLGAAKPPNAAPSSAPVTVCTSASANGSPAAAPILTPPMTFNYPNMPTNEAQYLAILQNSGYPFPIPVPPNYRGAHPQSLTFFNGSFYTSQMILQQQIQPSQLNSSILNGSSSQKQLLLNQQQRPQQGTWNSSNTFPAPKIINIESEKVNDDSPSTADTSRSTRSPLNLNNFAMPNYHQTQSLVGTSNGGNNTQSENRKQQQAQQHNSYPREVESLPRAYAMTFGLKNGGHIDEGKEGLTPKVTVTSTQSIAFTRPDPVISPLGSTNVVNSSANKLGSQSSQQLGQLEGMQFYEQMVQKQFQQQRELMQQQHQLQQQYAAIKNKNNNNKTPPTSNFGVFGDHLATSSPPVASKYSNTFSGFPQNLNNNSLQSHHSQWKSTGNTVSQVQPSSLKNLPQQQQVRLQQSHTQISFGAGEKSQFRAHESPPMRLSSPTNSLPKGTGGNPRTPSSTLQGNKAAVSSLSTQQSKNPSVLGNPNNTTSWTEVMQEMQQNTQRIQQLEQQMQLKPMGNNSAQPQPQLFFSPAAYMYSHPPQSAPNPSSNTTSGYYLQRQYLDNTKEAKASSGSESNNTKESLQGSNIDQLQFQVQPSRSFLYTNTVPAEVQVKPTTDQKQPDGNRENMTQK